MTIDWSDPAARNRLIERVGPDEYDRLHAEQMARNTVAIVNGHAIRKVQSRFGKLYQVGTTGTAFSAFEAAKTFASKKKGASDATGNRAQVSCRAR
jgi:hypothetical protein